jgi:hypothetical protein
MVKISTKTVLLLIVFAFAIIYRLLTMHLDVYPSGADIGLHNSVVNSITLSGGTDFQWNFYQMGGGFSLTFPGYHIFVSYIVLLTGLSEYIAFSLTVALFSSLMVFCSFLVTKAAWSESAGLIVAFLVAISRFDIEMLLWGGYPNAAALMFIPLIFYLYLEKKRFSSFSFLLVTGLLSATIFLSHSLTSVMFVAITILTTFTMIVFPKRLNVTRKRILFWILPLILGLIIVSPFLVDAIPAYLGANSGTFTGGVSDIQQALLSTRVLPLEWILPLFFSVFLFFLFSKKYRGQFFTTPSFLFFLWLLVPVLSTQGFLVGLYVDYNRFLYFVILPVIVLIGLGIDHGSNFFSRIINKYRSLTKIDPPIKKLSTKKQLNFIRRIYKNNIYGGFALVFLIISFFTIPIFLTPFQGRTIQSFYQVMNNPGYDAILWAKQNTPTGSVFVSDAHYGWWFSGFAQRPTLSAVDPQFLTLAREFEPAQVANSILDTNFVVDNGLIQIREDGGYIGRHNPMFLAKLNWTYFPYPFFHFNNAENTILLKIDDGYEVFDIMQLPITEMQVQNNSNQVSILVGKGNSYFNYTQQLTVYAGVRFVDLSIEIDTIQSNVSIINANYLLHTKGELVETENSVGFIDEGVKVLGQIIFDENQIRYTQVTAENPSGLYLNYLFNEENSVKLQLSIGVFSLTNNPTIYQNKETRNNYLKEVISSNLLSYQEEISSLPIEVFSYSDAIVNWDISYIAVRELDLIPKFARDPGFSLVFINDEVAIFKVNVTFFQKG